MQDSLEILEIKAIQEAARLLLNARQILVETIGVAWEGEARVLCITNNSLSPLAQSSSPALITASREVTIAKEAVASLVCQIALLDALFALIARAQGAQSRETSNVMQKVMIKAGGSS